MKTFTKYFSLVSLVIIAGTAIWHGTRSRHPATADATAPVVLAEESQVAVSPATTVSTETAAPVTLEAPKIYDGTETLPPEFVPFKSRISNFLAVVNSQSSNLLAGLPGTGEEPPPNETPEEAVARSDKEEAESQALEPVRVMAGQQVGQARAELEQALGADLMQAFYAWHETNGISPDDLRRSRMTFKDPSILMGRYTLAPSR